MLSYIIRQRKLALSRLFLCVNDLFSISLFSPSSHEVSTEVYLHKYNPIIPIRTGVYLLKKRLPGLFILKIRVKQSDD